MDQFSHIPENQGTLTQFFTDLYTEDRDYRLEAETRELQRLTDTLFKAGSDKGCKDALELINARFTCLPAYYYVDFISECIRNTGLYDEMKADSRFSSELSDIDAAYIPIMRCSEGTELLSFLINNPKYCEHTLHKALLAIIRFYNPCMTPSKLDKDSVLLEKICIAEDVRKADAPISRAECLRLGHDLRMTRAQMSRILTRLFQDKGYWNPLSQNDQIESLAFHLGLSYAETGTLKNDFSHYVSTQSAVPSLNKVNSDTITRYGRSQINNNQFAATLKEAKSRGHEAFLSVLNDTFFPWLFAYMENEDNKEHSVTAQAVYLFLFCNVNRYLDTSAAVASSGDICSPLNKALWGLIDKALIKEFAEILREEQSEGSKQVTTADQKTIYTLPQNKVRITIPHIHRIDDYITHTVDRHNELFNQNIATMKFDVWTNKKNSALHGRLEKLLALEEEVTRTDIIFLLFLAYSYTLEQNPGLVYSSSDLCRGFTEICNKVLSLAGLPEFYAPHKVEFAILYSMVKTGGSEVKADSPLLLYEYLCEETQTEAKDRNKENKAIIKLAQKYADTDTFGVEKYIAEDMILRIRGKLPAGNTRATLQGQTLIALLPSRYYTSRFDLTYTMADSIRKFRIKAPGYQAAVEKMGAFYEALSEDEPVKDILSAKDWSDYTPDFRKGFQKSEIRKKTYARILHDKILKEVSAVYPWILDQLSFPVPDIATYEELGIRIGIKARDRRG